MTLPAARSGHRTRSRTNPPDRVPRRAAPDARPGRRPCSPPATRRRRRVQRGDARPAPCPAGSPSWPTTPTRRCSSAGWTSAIATRHAGSYHIGRRHVTDDAGEPMVLDWRAPLSRTFYQASARDPQGVAVRRRFGFVGRRADRLRGRAPRPRRGARHVSRILTAEIERPRVGPMRDIVATIQPEQDELVRADLDQTRSACRARPAPARPRSGCTARRTCSTCTGSGCAAPACWSSGRTAPSCATSRRSCRRSARSRSQQSTVDDLVARVPVRGSRRARRGGALKHDARMAAVLRDGAVARGSAKPTDADHGVRTGRSAGGSPSRRCAGSSTRSAARACRTAIGRERVRARDGGAAAAPGGGPHAATRRARAWLRRMGQGRRRSPAFLDARLAGGHARAAGLLDCC